MTLVHSLYVLSALLHRLDKLPKREPAGNRFPTNFTNWMPGDQPNLYGGNVSFTVGFKKYVQIHKHPNNSKPISKSVMKFSLKIFLKCCYITPKIVFVLPCTFKTPHNRQLNSKSELEEDY